MADTVINFELPWNPAKKNQRIGRIDRLGQKSQKLNVYNLISVNSIEMRILAGLFLKQNLFDGVLSSVKEIDSVNFNDKGKSQFIRQLEGIMIDTEITDDENQTEDTGKINDNHTAINELEEMIGNMIEEKTESEKDHSQPTQKPRETHSRETESPDNTTSQKAEEYQQMEEVMSNGMDFLMGIFKMSTGKDMGEKGKPKVNVNKETGEVSITFKMKP